MSKFNNGPKLPPKQTPAEKLAATKKPGRKPRESRDFGALTCCCREIRLGLGLTIRDVSTATGISNPCICDVERGAETTITTARKLATFYGKTIDELWPRITHAPKRMPIQPSQ